MYTFGIFFVIIVIVCILVVGNGPRCAHYNCQNEVTREGDYCYTHRAYRTKSSDSNNTLSSGNSNNSIGNSSTLKSSYSNQTSEDDYSNSKSYSTSSSSGNKKQTQIKLIMMGMMMVTMMYIWMKIMTGIDTGRMKIMPWVWMMHLRTWKMEIGSKWQATC